MTEETSYGIIPLRLEDDEWEVLLVQHKNGGHWGFPKGHPEEGESPKETAERELTEETALQVTEYLPEHQLTEHYSFERGGETVGKTVHFFHALVHEELALDQSELLSAKWLPLEELLSYATFPEEKVLYAQLIAQLT